MFLPLMAKKPPSLGIGPLAKVAVVPLRWLSRLGGPGEEEDHDTNESCRDHTNEEFLKHIVNRFSENRNMSHGRGRVSPSDFSKRLTNS